jgi:hypothetical protein
MIIHGYTVSALGRLADTREHNSTHVPRRAVEGASRLLGVNGREFVARLGMKGLENVDLHWKSSDYSAALVTFAEDKDLLSTVVIVSGVRPEADRQALEAAQAMLRSVCETVGETAAEDLLQASERPAVVSIHWATRDHKAMSLVKDMEICFATTFLERAFASAKLMP